jgi:hypothetical protein
MPFALLIVGIVMVVTAVNNTVQPLAKLVKGDFTGNDNYFYWALAILVIGAIGYYSKLNHFSDAMLALVIVGMVVANKGFFKKFMTSVGLSTSSTSTVGAESVLG